MKNIRKFSVCAIILIVLLIIRFISQIFTIFLLITKEINFLSLIFLGILILVSLFYFIALIGIIKKTSWGLKFVIAIAMLDIILGFVLDLIMGNLGSITLISAIVVDVILIILAGNISKRIKK